MPLFHKKKKTILDLGLQGTEFHGGTDQERYSF